MRYIVNEKVLQNALLRRPPEPSISELADLYAHVGEALKQLDAQIRVAEQELEIFRVLRSIAIPSGREALDQKLNDNNRQDNRRF